MKVLLTSVIAIIFVSIIPFSFAEDEPYVLSHFSTKGVVAENNPFGGIVFWTIVDGDSGTVVTSSDLGLTIFRLSMTQSDSCEEEPNTVCLDATITSIKNSRLDLTDVGDTAKIVFEMPDRQTITMQSGEIASLEIELEIKKMRIKQVKDIVEEEIQEQEPSELEQEAWSKLQEALELINDSQIQQIITESNDEFAAMDDPYALIDQRDDDWLATDEEEMNPFMGTLLGSKVSEFLREVMLQDQQKPTDFVYEEIILTNSYGANVAITDKTSDYKQWDEQWWILAKRNGVYFETGFDQSAGVDSLAMSVRIADSDGRFLGVMKFVINTESAA